MQPLENTPDLKPILRCLLVFTACYGVAFIGSIATFQGLQNFYPSLVKPSWNPPNWLFAPVWTVLYGLMAAAAWQILESDNPNKGIALSVFVLQLAFNGLWSWLFFGWGKFGLSTIECAVMWVLILVTLLLFWKIKPVAGALLLPYLAWVAFATFLNFTIWRLNPDGPNTTTKITVEQSSDLPN
jgi:tryptophan-rich sensory protein